MDFPEVVISGIGGNYPGCENIRTFFESLEKEKSLIVTDHGRWEKGLYGMGDYVAVSTKLGLIDNVFFGLHRKLSLVTSPTTRTLIEKSFEAIIDAGLNPQEVYGSNAHVYMNAYDPEQEAFFLDNRGFTLGVVGTSKTMTANRISYFFGFTGKSCSITSSGIWLSQALEVGVTSIRSGECDMVLIGGGAGNKHPELTLASSTMDYASPDGIPRPFDAEGNGTVRSDVQIIFVLQRADLARRSYATVVGSIGRPADPRTGDILTPNIESAKKTIQELYTKCRVDPTQVQYVECNGSGHQVSDVTELEAIGGVLARNRKIPLLVGSAQGTVGHSDHAAGFLSAVKLIGIMETGVIPPTANHKTPHPSIESLSKGSVKVVTKRTEIDINEDQYFAVSEMSFVGDVGHTLLRVSARKKAILDPKQEIPRLVLLSIRAEAHAERIMNELCRAPFDPDYYSMVNKAFRMRIKAHPVKAYTICPPPENFVPQTIVDNFEERPVWFVFSGMGSQWPGMGRDLMRIPEFNRTIQRCHKALVPKGLNLIEILTSSDKTIFDSILHSFVGIAAVQIGLVKLLRLMDIKPTGFIGHSVGEQACAFMDDCINEEQTILCAYARGKASNESQLIPGMMAAIGLGFNAIKSRVPETIDVACHNSEDSCTISGPQEDVEKFVQELTEEKIFARTVNVSNIAYHSRYIKDVAPHLLRRLKEIIILPKKRSTRWISTSVPEEKWDTDEASYCSPQYLTNNLLNSVLFEEGLRHVPGNAILVEIAPHGLLQSILRKSGPKNSVNIPLTARNTPDGVSFFLNAVGRLYLEGLTPDISRIYPAIEYPISRGTASLTTLLSWSYVLDDNYIRESYDNLGDKMVQLNMTTPHETIRGVKYCTAANLLVQLWQSIAFLRKFNIDQRPVVFKDLCFFEPLELPVDTCLSLLPGLSLGSAWFEIRNGTRPILRGKALIEWNDDELKAKSCSSAPIKFRLNGDDVYSELAVRGQSYSPSHQQIQFIEGTDTEWAVRTLHKNNWDILLSTAFQTVQFHETEQSHLCVYPWRIRRLAIHPEKFLAANPQEGNLIFQPKTGIIYSEGLFLEGIEMLAVSPPVSAQTEINMTEFIAHNSEKVQSNEVIIKLGVQLASQLHPLSTSISLLHLKGSSDQPDIDIEDIRNCAANLGSKLDLTEYHTDRGHLPINLISESFAGLIICGISAAASAVSLALTFDVVLMMKVPTNSANPDVVAQLTVVAHSDDTDGRILLLRAAKPFKESPRVIHMDSNEPIESFDRRFEAGSFLVWNTEPFEGVQTVVEKFYSTFDRALLMLVFILDSTAPPFSIDSPLYKRQLTLGWRVNIYKYGAWGTLQYMALPKEIGQFSKPEDDIINAVSIQSAGDVSVDYWGINERNSSKGQGTKYVVDYSGTNRVGTNVIGIAYTKRGRCHLDVDLRWHLPEEWSPEDGATVPVAYSLAYYALKILAKVTPKSSILITDASTPEGQALVNVALSLGGRVFAYIPKKHKVEFSDFPQIGRKNVEIFNGNVTLSYQKIKNMCPGGVDILVTIQPNDLTSTATTIVGSNGTILHYGGFDPSGITKLGMFPFVYSIKAYGVNVERLTTLRVDEKKIISSLVKEGLKPGGAVRPLKRLVLPQSLTSVPWNAEWFKTRKVVNRVNQLRNTYMCSRSSFIVAGTPHENAILTEWFISRGAADIVAVQNKFLYTNCRNIEEGTSIFTEADIPAALYRASTLGKLECAAIVTEKSTDTEELIRQMELFKSVKGVTVLVLARDDSARGSVIKACESFQAGCGGRAVLIAGSVETAVSTKLLDWLLSTDEKPKFVHLGNMNENISPRVPGTDLLDKLPNGDSLAALYTLLKSEPIVQELPTMSVRQSYAREIFPLFALPSFSGLPLEVLKPLAAGLLAPLFSIQLPNRIISIKQLAQDIAEAIRKVSPTGPYAVLGLDWTAVISQLVALELRKRGETVLLFLLDSDLKIQLKDLKQFKERSDSDVLLIKRVLGTKASTEVLFQIASLPSWEERIKAVTPLLASNADLCIPAAHSLNRIHHLISLLSEHALEDSDIDMYLLRSGHPYYNEYDESKNVHFCGVVEPHHDIFTSKRLLDFINSNMARPGMRTLAKRLAAVRT